MTLQYSNAIGDAILLSALALVQGEVRTARAETTTECTINKFCYCVNSSLKNTIEKQVAYIGRQIREQKAQGKAIGYMSIPISTGEGSYLGVNAKVAAEVAERVADHFGVRSFWILDPARKDFALPSGASGAEYMLMWTKVLEGEDGLGPDFDFIYFVGPSDFAKYFSLDGHADMEKLDAYYERLASTDPGIKTVDKKQFGNYYAVRASVTDSRGC